MSIYIDLVFLVNFIFDAEILYILIRLCQKKFSFWRYFSASLMGGLQGVLFFVPYFRILSVPPIGILIPVLLVAIILLPCNIKELLTGYILFLTISFIYSGAINLFGLKISSAMLLFVPIGILVKVLKNRILAIKRKAEIFYKGKSIKMIALYDSGNCVTYLGKLVIFGNKNVFKQIFGENFEKNDILELSEESVCFIPYKTIDGGGIMLGIKLEKAIIDKKEYKNVILAYFENDLKEDLILNGNMF